MRVSVVLVSHIAKANTRSALHLAVPVVQRQAEGWIHKGLSGLEGMVTSLSPK